MEAASRERYLSKGRVMMRANKHVTILLAFLGTIVFCGPSARGADLSGQTPASRHVETVVRITADSAVVPLDFAVIQSLLISDAVAGEAARTVLNVKYGEVFHSIEVRPTYVSQESMAEQELPAEAGAEVVVPPVASRAQTTFLSLVIDLPDRVKPVAWPFADAVVENLRRELNRAFDAHVELLKDKLKRARSEQDEALTGLSAAMKDASSSGKVAEIPPDPADEAVHRQLDTLVDLSSLRAEQPFDEVIERLRRSVEPPLQVVVLWRELLDNVQVERSTPINIEGMTTVKLRTGLSKVLEGLSNPQLNITLGYVVSDGVITIGTKESLPQRKMETRVYDLPAPLRAAGRADGLMKLIETTIEPDSWFDLSGLGEGTITGGEAKLIVWQTRDVHRKIADLLRAVAATSRVVTPLDAPRETLEQQMQFLLTYRSTLEQEIDKLQDRQRVLGQQKHDPEKETMRSSLLTASDLLPQVIAELETIKAHLSAGSQDSPDIRALDGTIRTIKTCADACMRALSWGKAFDGPGMPTDMFTAALEPGEKQTLSRRLAAKQAELDLVGDRIMRIHDALTGQMTLDPEAHRLQLAAERLKEADSRVQQLETRMAELQPCTVTLFLPGR